MSAECECGFEAKNERGLSVHQRHCDEHDDDGCEEPSPSKSVPTAVAGRLAERAFERDDEECQKCGSSENLTIHKYRDDRERLANLVTLCQSCDDDVSGYHHLTRRNMVRGVYE